MIDITEQRQKCFAYIDGGACDVLKETQCHGCKFYKPADCEDWIRQEIDGRVYITPPEEYEELYKRKEKKKHDKRARLFGKGALC